MSDKTLHVVKVAKDAAYIQMADLERLRAEVLLDSILVGQAWSDGQFSSSCCMIHKPHLSD